MFRYGDPQNERRMHIPGSTTNGWKGSWKKYLFEYMWIRGTFLLYPNFDKQFSFSTNHVEPGEHIRADDPELLRKRAMFTVPLIQTDEQYTSVSFEKPLSPMVAFDIFGSPFFTTSALINSLDKLTKGSEHSTKTTTTPGKLDRNTCTRFSPFVSDYVSRPGVTVMMSVNDENNQGGAPLGRVVMRQLEALARVPAVKRVLLLVVTSKSKNHKRKTALVGNMDVHIFFRGTTEGTNRLKLVPNNLISTDAVLLLDSSVHMGPLDVITLYDAWRAHPKKVVGYLPVYADAESSGYVGVSTKSAMAHRRMLYSYTCDRANATFSAKVHTSLLQVVDESRSADCEGLVLTEVAARLSSEDGGALYVAPNPQGELGAYRPSLTDKVQKKERERWRLLSATANKTVPASPAAEGGTSRSRALVGAIGEVSSSLQANKKCHDAVVTILKDGKLTPLAPSAQMVRSTGAGATTALSVDKMRERAPQLPNKWGRS